MNWTKAKIEQLLRTNDKAVDRAMTVLYDRQTRDEQATSDTRHTNQRGFSACHAKRGSYFGRWVKSDKRLTGHHLAKAREIALHYTQQLADEANAKAVKPAVAQVVEAVERLEPMPGTYAFTARLLAQSGIMTGDEADAWKDMMKDGE